MTWIWILHRAPAQQLLCPATDVGCVCCQALEMLVDKLLVHQTQNSSENRAIRSAGSTDLAPDKLSNLEHADS